MALTALSAIAVACASTNAAAQEKSTADTGHDFQVPAQPLSQSIVAVASTANIQVLYSDELPPSVQAPALSGRMSVDEALARLLSGTGYTFRYTQPGVITIIAATPAGSPDGERVLGAVRVQGSQGGSSALPGSSPVNGINGSRDVTATEGTGSYTSNALTVGSKTAASIKDTPMSVSVLTSQRLQDQNITDLNLAMRNLPGVTVTQGSSADELKFYSRGFEITQFQFDGGAPMNTAGTAYNRVIDLSLYDHIELVRGAAGTFTGFGDPGGIINLVRKKPLDHQQFLLDMQIGSWDWHRVSVDVTGPLAFGGKLRGRFIATHQDNNFFYKIAKANRNVLSASLEYDLTPSTLVSIGFNYQDSHDLPFVNGFVRYQDGRSLGLPRSTCFCFDYAKNNAENREFFGQIDQRIGDKWTLKIKGTRIQQRQASIGPSIFGSVNPYTLLGSRADTGGYLFNHIRATMLEVTLDGSFRLFGRDQKIVFGANYSMSDPAGTLAGQTSDPYTGATSTFPGMDLYPTVNILTFNSSQFIEPPFPPGYSSKVIYGDYRYLNSYLNLSLNIIKHLHINTGLRYSGYRNRDLINRTCYLWDIIDNNSVCFNHSVGDQLPTRSNIVVKGSDFSWPPSISWSYDITNNLTGSAVYNDIYIDQSNSLDRNGNPMPPITGKNFEGELKWTSPSRKLNAGLSVYYTKQLGYAAGDPICSGDIPDARCTSTSTSNPGQVAVLKSCCYIFDPTRENISYGTDIEISGEIRRGWQLSASYNFNYNYVKNAKIFDGSAQPLTAFAPRHRLQLWTSYTAGENSRFKGLSVSFGAQAQTKTFRVDSYCTTFAPHPVTGLPRCVARQAVSFTDPGHVVLSGAIGYKINSQLQFDLQMENLLDKTYYETVGGIGGGNFYGSPRSFKLSMRVKL
ncbi:TonB-dependent receptor [Sphingomonas sp.]|uniref:TonB-dependent siderophore receptor n=1 Tax=Sphingomonas sp. TaxID=28214 RepID=UPI0025E0ABEE|nr:TonB-dependent receptor [Sphingomonas sp.]